MQLTTTRLYIIDDQATHPPTQQHHAALPLVNESSASYRDIVARP